MLSKESALRFARKWTPLYAEVFQELKSEGGRVKISGRFARIRSNVGSYVQLYDDERKPGVSILIALIGEEGFKKLNEDSATWAEREVSEFIEELVSDDTQDELLQELGIPETEAEWIKQEQEFQALWDSLGACFLMDGLNSGKLSRFSPTRPPSDEHLFLNGLGPLSSFMAREGITDIGEAIGEFFHQADAFHRVKDAAGMRGYLYRKASLKGKRFNTIKNDFKDEELDALTRKAAAAYQTAKEESDG